MKHVVGIALGCIVGIVLGCHNLQEAHTVERVVVDVTDAVCTLAESTGNIYVDFICVIAEGVEGVVTVLTPGVQAIATMSKTQMTVRVPVASAKQFAAEHTAAAIAARKVARGK